MGTHPVIFFASVAVGTWLIYNHVVNSWFKILALYVECALAISHNPLLDYADYQVSCILKNIPYKSQEEWIAEKINARIATYEQEYWQKGWALVSRLIVVAGISGVFLWFYEPIVLKANTSAGVVHFIAYIACVNVIKRYTNYIALMAVGENNIKVSNPKFSYLLLKYMPRAAGVAILLFVLQNIVFYLIMEKIWL